MAVVLYDLNAGVGAEAAAVAILLASSMAWDAMFTLFFRIRLAWFEPGRN
jgi:hypothetical protein